jgi:hypothetical protein
MIKLSKDTIALIEDIESRIDPNVEDRYNAEWMDFLYDRFDGDVFDPVRTKKMPRRAEIPSVHINDAIEDLDLMIRFEMQEVSALLERGRGPLGIRANYGTGTMASLFGAEIFMMPREMGNLPTTKPFNDTEKVKAILEKGIPSLDAGFGGRMFEFGETVAETFEKYPKIKKYVDVFHPDTQGPLDMCEMIWGCDMFYEMYDDLDLVHEFLSLLTDTFIAVSDRWHKIFPIKSDMSSHWRGFNHRGGIVLRSDSAMNISPELYREFSMPYDAKLLEKYGGGVIHFCGRGDHYIEMLSCLPQVFGVNMSQPECNDMEKIYKNTVDKGIKLLSFDRKAAMETASRSGGFKKCMHVQ